MRSNGLDHARLGLSVGVRAAGGAVRRNRLKRLLREWFRHHQHATPPCDVVVNVRPAAARAAPDELARSLNTHWERLRKRCERS
jgi:ribonuclease P protein component